MALKDIFPPPLRVIMQTHYPLLVHQQPQSPLPEFPTSSLPSPCAKPEFSGENRVDQKVISLKAKDDNVTEQLGEMEPERSTCISLKLSPEHWAVWHSSVHTLC